MRRRWYQPGVIVLLMITLMCTVACNDKGKVRERASNEQTEITEDFVPITDIEEGRPDIYVIVKSMTSSYWEVVLDGAKQAGIDKECNIYAAGSRLETEWKLQEAYVKLAVERGADGIILGPDNSVKLSSVVDTVHKKGIPIIIVDTLVNTQNYDICYMTDNLFAGENAAKEMIRILKEKGHKDEDKLEVAIELGARNSQTINERLAGFSQYWAKYAPDTWTIIDESKCNDGDEEFAVELSEDVFKEYPDVEGVFGTDNASSIGFSSAMLKFDRRDVAMVCFDYSPEVAAIVENGNYDVSVMLQRQYNMGYNGVEAILSIKGGKKSELKFVDTGVAILNKETMNSEEIQQIIQGNRGK